MNKPFDVEAISKVEFPDSLIELKKAPATIIEGQKLSLLGIDVMED